MKSYIFEQQVEAGPKVWKGRTLLSHLKANVVVQWFLTTRDSCENRCGLNQLCSVCTDNVLPSIF